MMNLYNNSARPDNTLTNWYLFWTAAVRCMT